MGEPHTYQTTFLITAGLQDFLVEGHQGRATKRTGICLNFMHNHMWDTVIIVEEGNPLHPWYNQCDILLLWAGLSRNQPNTAQCKKGVDRKRRRLSAEEVQSSPEQTFQEYGHPLTSVSLFNYLGCVLMGLDDDSPTVVGNLWKSQNKWAWLQRILGREGENMRVSGKLFIAAVQVVLLFGYEAWVITTHMGWALGGV